MIIIHFQGLLKTLGNDKDRGGRAPYYTEYNVGNAIEESIQPLHADILRHCNEPTEVSM